MMRWMRQLLVVLVVVFAVVSAASTTDKHHHKSHDRLKGRDVYSRSNNNHGSDDKIDDHTRPPIETVKRGRKSTQEILAEARHKRHTFRNGRSNQKTLAEGMARLEEAKEYARKKRAERGYQRGSTTNTRNPNRLESVEVGRSFGLPSFMTQHEMVSQRKQEQKERRRMRALQKAKFRDAKRARDVSNENPHRYPPLRRFEKQREEQAMRKGQEGEQKGKEEKPDYSSSLIDEELRDRSTKFEGYDGMYEDKSEKGWKEIRERRRRVRNEDKERAHRDRRSRHNRSKRDRRSKGIESDDEYVKRDARMAESVERRGRNKKKNKGVKLEVFSEPLATSNGKQFW